MIHYVCKKHIVSIKKDDRLDQGDMTLETEVFLAKAQKRKNR